MKKTLKILGITTLAILVLAVGFIAVLIIKGPTDAVILTEEEEEEQQQEQTDIYADMDLSGFNTVSVTGEVLTSEDCFSDYEITMVNLWVTNCSPCIAEMPGIEELYEDRPEDSNIITICLDASDSEKDAAFAAEIMANAGSEFMTLIPDDRITEALRDITTIFPTTIFVDSEGKTIGAPHFGGRTAEDYRTAILERMALIDQEGEQTN